jgi:hypothetical protein
VESVDELVQVGELVCGLEAVVVVIAVVVVDFVDM